MDTTYTLPTRNGRRTPTVDTLHYLSRGSYGRPPHPPTLPVLATHSRHHSEEPLAPGTIPRPRLPPHRRATRATHPPTGGTYPRPARPVDVHPPGKLRHRALQRGTKHAPTMYSAPPSLQPHGGCGPRMTPSSSAPVPRRPTHVETRGLHHCTTGGVASCVIAACVLSRCTCMLCLLLHSNT